MVSHDTELEILRRNYVKERYSVVLTLTVLVFFCTSLVAAFLLISIVLDTNANSQESSEQARYALPCVNSDDYPSVPPNIKIRVLNGSNLSGYATAVAKSLEYRGFAVTDIDTTEVTDVTTIYYGKNAYRQAYTLAGHFTDAIMILDDREDGLIDVVIGRVFVQLQDEVLVKTSDTSIALTSPSKCSLINSIVPQIAILHDTEVAPAYDEKGNLPTNITDGGQEGSESGLPDNLITESE